MAVLSPRVERVHPVELHNGPALAGGAGSAQRPGVQVVHVVEVSVAVTPPQPPPALERWLRPHEQQGWRERLDPADRQRSRTGRALLRALAAQVTGDDPASIVFVTRCPVCGDDGHGRPRVAGNDTLFTSVAHAGDAVLAAVAGVPIGVDVERFVTCDFDGFDDVALTARERAVIAELPPSERRAARTAIWVRKEALLKRHEVGLSIDPRDVELGLDDHDRVIADPLAPDDRVALVGVAVAAGYRAALAVAADVLPTVTMLDSRQLWAAPAARSRRSSD